MHPSSHPELPSEIRLEPAAAPGLQRRALLALPLAAACPLDAAQATDGSAPVKTLRVMLNSAETSFDPARITDLYSRTITAHIFEALYGYDALARPAKPEPKLAAALPEVSADFKTWTVRLKPGVRFADDPAFRGRPRELVADDVIYSFKRLVDPANKSPQANTLLDEGIVGLAELRQAALDSRKPMDYAAPVDGMLALDRHTLRFTLKAARPRFIQLLSASDFLGTQAHEVVAMYGESIGEHPVGSGPFRLKQWVRGSRIVLERNPHYREVLYDAQPDADDAAGQAILAQFKGRRLPMVDRVEVAIIEENQPQWLAFLNGEIDALVANTGSVPLEFAMLAVPNGKLAPNLARQGIQLHRSLRSDCAMAYLHGRPGGRWLHARQGGAAPGPVAGL